MWEEIRTRREREKEKETLTNWQPEFCSQPRYKIIYHTTFNNSTALSQFTAQGQLSFQNRILNAHKMLPWLKFSGGPSRSVVSHKLHKSQEPCQHTRVESKDTLKDKGKKEYRTWLEVVIPQTNLNRIMPGLCGIV